MKRLPGGNCNTGVQNRPNGAFGVRGTRFDPSQLFFIYFYFFHRDKLQPFFHWNLLAGTIFQWQTKKNTGWDNSLYMIQLRAKLICLQNLKEKKVQVWSLPPPPPNHLPVFKLLYFSHWNKQEWKGRGGRGAFWKLTTIRRWWWICMLLYSSQMSPNVFLVQITNWKLMWSIFFCTPLFSNWDSLLSFSLSSFSVLKKLICCPFPFSSPAILPFAIGLFWLTGLPGAYILLLFLPSIKAFHNQPRLHFLSTCCSLCKSLTLIFSFPSLSKLMPPCGLNNLKSHYFLAQWQYINFCFLFGFFKNRSEPNIT